MNAVYLADNDGNDRAGAFRSGLERLGYRVTDKAKPDPSPHDVLVLWNRPRGRDDLAAVYESRGARVLIAENGYIGRDENGRQLYALAQSRHNGAGRWHVGQEDRWSRLNIEVQPWRCGGEHILVLPQRGIGSPGVAMPHAWPDRIVSRLREATKRPIRVRHHPKQERPSLDPDFKNCWAAVTWASGAGIKAIVAGIPVFHDLENWIGAPAASFGLPRLETPFLGDRAPMLHRLSWAQWTKAEISSGEAIKCVLA